MKAINLNLQNSISSVYDKTKTTVSGRVIQKTINSQQVLGPTLTQFVDTQTQALIVPSYTKYNPSTGRLFVLSVISSSPTLLLFNVSLAGVQTYVGKVVLTLANSAATTHTIRGFDVDDNGATWQIILGTSGSVVINGGVFMAYGLTLSDFTPAGQTIWSAQSTGQKGIYFLQDNLYKGVNHNMTTLWGLTKMYSSPNSLYNTKLYCLNNTALLPQVLSFDLAGTPAVSDTTTGISSQAVLYAGTSPSAFFTSGSVNPSMSASDPVILTGTVPANFTASLTNAAQTVYFIRDIQLVSGQYYFNLSLTSAGAAVTPTSAVSGTINIMRAFGTCTNLFYGRTPIGGLSPALTGTLVQSNIVDHARPTSVPLNATLNSQDCIALATSTQLYLGKVSELFIGSNGTSSASTITITGLPAITLGMAVSGPGITPGTTVNSVGNTGGVTTVGLTSPVTTAQPSSVLFVFGAFSWPSLTGSNILGTGLDIVAPTLLFMKYSDLMDRFIYITNTSICIVKQLKNNEITGKFGNVDDTWLEAPSTLPTVPSGMTTVSSLEVQGGIVFLSGSATGQRGVTFTDIYSDRFFGFSYIVSPVTSINKNSVLRYINSLEQLFDYTNTMNFYIRSATTPADAVFNSASGGWIQISKAMDLALSITDSFFQIKIDFNILGALNATPSQINDVVLSVIDPNELSNNWEGSVDNTSQNGASPSYTALRMIATDSGTKYFRAYDDSGNLVVSANTSANFSSFDKSSDGGVSWTAMAGANDYLSTPYTTLIRYKWTTPPAVDVTCSLRDL